MIDPTERRIRNTAIQLENAVNGEAANAQAKLRINDRGMPHFSHKAPGLKSALIGRSGKLTEVKKCLDAIANGFKSNRTDLTDNTIQARTRGVRNEAAALSRRVTTAIAQSGDVTAADCVPLQQAIHAAVDPNAE
jgi:hypothetical protein